MYQLPCCNRMRQKNDSEDSEKAEKRGMFNSWATGHHLSLGQVCQRSMDSSKLSAQKCDSVR